MLNQVHIHPWSTVSFPPSRMRISQRLMRLEISQHQDTPTVLQFQAIRVSSQDQIKICATKASVIF